MIDYSNMPDDGAASRRWGWIAAVVYILVVALSMLLVKCDTRAEEVDDASSGSLVISFGDVSLSSGEREKSIQTPPAPPTPPVPPTPAPEPTPQPTDESSDIETPTPQEVIEPQPEPEPEVVEPQPDPEPESEPEPDPEPEVVPEAKPREVNRRALFPGTSATTKDAGEGESKEAESKGVEGSDRGTPDQRGSLGEGLTGDYSLAGRSLMGALPVPSYNAQTEGRVVIAITVDEKGRVTSASLKLESSTTNDSRLIDAARNAALKARFSQSEEFIQSGTITYIFKMN